ncbi:sialidase family protein [Bacteroidota bacterium]
MKNIHNKQNFTEYIFNFVYSTVIYFILFFGITVYAQSFKIVVPDIPGIKVFVGESIPIPTKGKVKTAQAFKFNDGRIVTGTGENSMWSYDNGYTWQSGPNSQIDKTAIDLGNGEILSIGRNSKRRPDGKFSLRLKRSTDNWKTIKTEQAELDIPNASYTVTGSGGRVDGFLFHHGIVQLPNGDLVGTMYGNYEGDVLLCAGYPTELNQRKYRTVVVFSKDKGKTWGDHVLVAYDKMLGRGIPLDHDMVGKSIPESRAGRPMLVPAITMEGFREADLTIAANGDLVCVMRSGGRNPKMGVNLFPTPLYCSRSSDGGKHWTPPEQIADRGVCPSIITMSNGILVCTYSRPGNWLIFSDDDGKTWKGAFQFGTTGHTNFIEETAPDLIQVYHETGENNFEQLRGTFFKVEKIK